MNIVSELLQRGAIVEAATKASVFDCIRCILSFFNFTCVLIVLHAVPLQPHGCKLSNLLTCSCLSYQVSCPEG